MLRRSYWMLRELVFHLSFRLRPHMWLSRSWPFWQRGSWVSVYPVEKSTDPTASIASFRWRALVALILLFPSLVAAQGDENPAAAVQAILFYSPSCPHCHQVINELLLPMQEEYGEQLQIVGIDISHPAGNELYDRSIEHFKIPETRQGVPTLIVRDTILVGGREIPEQFPAIVEEGLAAGGIGWPDIPDLALIVPDLPSSADPTAQVNTSEPIEEAAAPAAAGGDPVAQVENPRPDALATPSSAGSLEQASREVSAADPAEDPPADPVGFALAWIVLIGMVAALVYALWQIVSAWPPLPDAVDSTWLVPLLALVGLGVASYLAYVEVNQVSAVCGPIGECNIVQSSSYAKLFGIPIAVLGVLSYVAILLLWFGQRYLPARTSSWCSLGLVLLTIFGTLFSIYLTLLEIFVIEAVCLWCLSSAVLTTLIMLLVTKDIKGRSPQAKLVAQTKH